jgi:serine/threonine-protein kinase
VDDASVLPALPRAGEHVDRYEVLTELSHGGMAALYVGRRTSVGGFDKLVALKLLLPHLSTDRRFVEMFLDEARIASAIQHPNVVHVYDVGEHGALPFMVMELLRGQPLSKLISKARSEEQTLPLSLLVGILADASEGLHAAHETRSAEGEALKVVHRDVSPHNIHVGYDGQVKVIDFGIAAARGRLQQTHSGELKGKFRYLAPEQMTRDRAPDRRTDVWALGVTAWELLAGRRLFGDEDENKTLWNVMHMPVEDLRAHAPEVSEELASTVMACLDRDPAGRPGNCKQLARAFREAAHTGDDQAERARFVSELFAAERAAEEERLTAARRRAQGPGGEGTSDESTARSQDIPESSTRDDSSRRGRRWPAMVALALLALTAGAVGWARFGDAGGPPRDGASHAPGSTPKAARATNSQADTPVKGAAPAPAISTDGELEDTNQPSAGANAVSDGGLDIPSRPHEPSATTDHAGEGGPARTTVVHPDPRARVVLVDGQERESRPLRLRLKPGRTVEIELVGPRGRRVRRTVGVDDDGARIALPSPRRQGRRPEPNKPEEPPETEPAESQGDSGGTGDSRGSTNEPLMGNPY